jgi:hypothetical protein
MWGEDWRGRLIVGMTELGVRNRDDKVCGAVSGSRVMSRDSCRSRPEHMCGEMIYDTGVE